MHFWEQGVNNVQCVSMASWYYYLTSTVGINVNTFYIVAETEHRHILLLINYTLYSYLWDSYLWKDLHSNPRKIRSTIFWMH